ncbi:WD40 repeat-like protein [Pluteus cervinus]|uniref:WD40 repeat-like protein n=1 Tax=Pluteus cervinus TaxID=181527 RepID=A0ACD3A2Y1_9AGAR|nr:WD40 repeat-like protein [Pluteus cervinus]
MLLKSSKDFVLIFHQITQTQSTSTQQHAHLHALYTIILEQIISSPENISAYQVVFGTILLAVEPMSIQALSGLLETHVPGNVVTNILHLLQNLLFFNKQGKIQIIHPSLADFLLSPQAARFYINSGEMQTFLFQQCISVLSKQLKFNICHLETSYRTNVEISDLQIRITNNVSSELQYSCLYWIQHLLSCETFPEPLLNSLFVNIRVLFWIECLSLLNKLDFGFNSIKKLHHTHSVYEVYYFISRFYIPIATSAPHLYLSTLPFLPINSLIYKTCYNHFPNRAILRSQQEIHWRANSFMLSGADNGSESILFLPLTNLICSAFSHDIIQIWDPYSGQKVEHKIIGHINEITVLALLYDKKILISGSRDYTLCFWDFNTFRMMYQPFNQHSKAIISLLLTQDHQTLFSACFKKVICWELSKGFPIISYVHEPVYGVRSLCLTTNDQYLVCGTQKHIVIIWNAQTGTKISEFGNIKYEIISSVACTPTNDYVVCGYSRGWILAWDLKDHHETKIDKIGNHPIICVIITKDGKYTIVASGNWGLYIYNSHTMEQICNPLISQNGFITHISLSDDEHYLAVSLDSAPIQVWDFNALLQEAQLGHKNSSPNAMNITAIMFLPDCKHFAMSAQDRVCIWDISTGNMTTRLALDNVTSLAYISRKECLIAGTSNGSIILCDMLTGKTLFKEFQGHTKEIVQTTLRCKDTQLLSWANDGTLRIWDVDYPRIMESQSDDHHTNISFLLGGEKVKNVQFYENTTSELCGYINQDGWLVYRNRYYLWIPPYYRLSLENPQLNCLPPTEANSCVHIDWSLFAHGNQWADIYCQE